MSPVLFSMVYERQPLTLDDLPRLGLAWLQEAGGFAAAGLAIWLLAFALGLAPPGTGPKRSLVLKLVFLLCAAGAAGAYLVVGWIYVLGGYGYVREQAAIVGGALALTAVCLPFAVDVMRLRGPRILAIAWLSIKEALYSKIVWVPVAGSVVLVLFGAMFMPTKPDSQLRTYVQVVFWVLTTLTVFTAAVLGSFGIPNDLRQHTIYSLVTKPVERFEIVLGRWLGYTAILTLVLALTTSLSLATIWLNGVHPDSAAESWKARVPIYGELDFRGRPAEAGTRVPREWDHRRFIPGGPDSSARAMWSFRELPSWLDERRSVPCEFAFDIYRTTKGEENKGILASFVFETWRWHPARKVDYDRELAGLLKAEPNPSPTALAAIHDRLALEFGYFEFPSKEVYDFTTYAIDVPSGLFKNAREGYSKVKQQAELAGRKPPPFVIVSVKCEDPRQFLGMARHDLYLLDSEGWFGINFFKGSLGLWFRICLVLGVAVACSTYLSGIVSLLVSLFLYATGMLEEYIRAVADKNTEVGGPAEGLYRLVNRMVPNAPMEATATAQTVSTFDEAFRWFLHRFLTCVPDVERFDLTDYVAEGFDIPGTTLLIALLLVAGYLLPWAILAYYSITSREVAS